MDWRRNSIFEFNSGSGKDLFAKAVHYADFVQSGLSAGVYGYHISALRRDGGRVFVKLANGTERWLIDAASNNYLGLSGDPRLVQKIQSCISTFGVGAQGASMLNGNTPVHEELRLRLATFLGKEKVLLSPSGYSAMQAAIQGLARPTDVIFYDRYCHSSLVDGMLLSGAMMYKYPHNDMNALEKLLERFRHGHHGALIVSDGVCSIDGSVAPVPDLIRLKNKYECRLFVDDAHGIGVMDDGRGCAAHAEVDLLGGVFSKAFGSGGGFIAGSAAVIEYLNFFGRANCSTTNLSVANTAAALAALEIIESEPARVHALNELAKSLRERLSSKGIPTIRSLSPVISIIVGKDADAYAAWKLFVDRGVLTHALPFPIVPMGKARIRLRLSTLLNGSQLDAIAEAAADLCRLPKASRDQKANFRDLEAIGFQAELVPTRFGGIVAYSKGRGDAWLFLHPLLFGAELYAPLFQHWDFPGRIIALDLWGHGAAPPTTSPLTLGDVAEVVAGVLDALGIRTPIKIFGTSLGAMLALRFADRYPQRTSQMVLVGASADAEEAPLKRVFESMLSVADALGGEAVLEDVLSAMFSAHFLENHPVLVQAACQTILKRPPDDFRPLVAAVLERQPLVDRLPAICVPTKVMVGTSDMAEPIAHSETLATLLPNAAFVRFDGVGHLVPLEAPRAVAQLLSKISAAAC